MIAIKKGRTQQGTSKNHNKSNNKVSLPSYKSRVKDRKRLRAWGTPVHHAEYPDEDTRVRALAKILRRLRQSTQSRMRGLAKQEKNEPLARRQSQWLSANVPNYLQSRVMDLAGRR